MVTSVFGIATAHPVVGASSVEPWGTSFTSVVDPRDYRTSFFIAVQPQCALSKLNPTNCQFFSDFICTNLPSCAQLAGNSSPARPGTRPFRAARHRMWCQPVLKSHNAVSRIGLIFGSASFLH